MVHNWGVFAPVLIEYIVIFISVSKTFRLHDGGQRNYFEIRTYFSQSFQTQWDVYLATRHSHHNTLKTDRRRNRTGHLILQCLGCMLHVIINKAGNEKVAVIVPILHPRGGLHTLNTAFSICWIQMHCHGNQIAFNNGQTIALSTPSHPPSLQLHQTFRASAGQRSLNQRCPHQSG